MTEACSVDASPLRGPEASGVSAGCPRWYVIESKPREDARARRNLERQGFTCYCPVVCTEKLRQGRRVWLEEPLFPRYFFIQLDKVGQNWAPIRSTRGVLQLVRVNDHPLPVADEIILSIRKRLATEHPCVPYFKAGERVRISEGPFANLEGIFLAPDGEERVVLLLNLLHQNQTLSFPVAGVRKAKALV